MMTRQVIGREIGARSIFRNQQLRPITTRIRANLCARRRVALREILVSTDGKNAAGLAAAEKKKPTIFIPGRTRANASPTWRGTTRMRRRLRRAET